MQVDVLRDTRSRALPVAVIIGCAVPGLVIGLAVLFERYRIAWLDDLFGLFLPLLLFTPVLFVIGVVALRRVNARMPRPYWLALCMLLAATPLTWVWFAGAFVQIAGMGH